MVYVPGCYENAPDVIVIDGLLSKISVDFLEAVRGSVHVISSKHKQSPRSIKLCSSQIESFYDEIYKSIDNGEKIFVGMSTMGKDSQKLNSVESLTSTLISKYGWTLGKEIISYHSLKKKEKKALINCEEVWGHPDIRVIIGNSSIAVGISYDPNISRGLKLFDRIFATMMYVESRFLSTPLQSTKTNRYKNDNSFGESQQ